ncbi:MAG: hypothetical protein Q8N79_06440 [Candidatus Methanoperedens sp.]|nr:hypothetical protein [Candidatus Methanoperedens sp.]
MNVNAKVIHEFAIELKKVVEEFEEEMEILSNKEMMDELKASEESRKKGDVVTFNSVQELKKSLGL